VSSGGHSLARLGMAGVNLLMPSAKKTSTKTESSGRRVRFYSQPTCPWNLPSTRCWRIRAWRWVAPIRPSLRLLS